jgi:hypothetical protein
MAVSPDRGATRLYKQSRADPACKPISGLLHPGVQNGLSGAILETWEQDAEDAQIGGYRTSTVLDDGDGE